MNAVYLCVCFPLLLTVGFSFLCVSRDCKIYPFLIFPLAPGCFRRNTPLELIATSEGAIVSLFFSRFASAEVAPGFNSWDDVKAAADGGQVNVYMWGGSDAINGFVDDFYGVPLKNDYNIALNRMPLAGTVDAVNQVLSEKEAGVRRRWKH